MLEAPVEKRCALVTGGARRIGAAIVRHLHRAGYDVALHFRASADEASALCAELNTIRPGSAVPLRADLAKASARKVLIERAADRWGGLDLLVNNAAAFFPTPFGEVAESQWDALFDADLKAPFFLCQTAWPWLKRRQGCIVNLADIHAERGLPRYAPYSIAKAGLAAMTRCLAKEMAPDVRVNAVAPGAILWPEKPMDAAEEAQILARIPLARPGHPDDIAKAVLYLARDASYVTGQVLAVDGGRTLFN